MQTRSPLLTPRERRALASLQTVRVQLGVADMAVVGGVVTFPDQRGLFGAGRQVAIDTVDAHIEAAIAEPIRLPPGEVELADLVPGGVPVDEFAGHLRPESVGVLDRPLVHALIGVGVDVSGGLECLGYGAGGEIRHGGSGGCTRVAG